MIIALFNNVKIIRNSFFSQTKIIIILALATAMILSSCGKTKQNDDPAPPLNTNVVISDSEKPVSANNNTDGESGKDQEPVIYNDYNISVDVNPETRKVSGIEKVLYKNRTGVAIDKIYFNLYLNSFNRGAKHQPYFKEFTNKIFASGNKDFGYMNIIDVAIGGEEAEYIVNDSVLSINLGDILNPDESIDISLQFEAYVPAINHRTGANAYGMWFGNFFPVLAVYDKTGWHTDPYYPAGNPFYSNIANYVVKVTTPIGYTVIGTGEESVAETEDRRQTTTLTSKMVRDFAFAVSDSFEVASVQTNSGIYINVYHYSGLEYINDVLVMAIKGLDYFGDILGVYPYASLDIIETGLFAETGMDYPQTVFMDSDFLKKGNFDDVLIHTIGRQWLYNVVGSNQVKESWLSSGVVAVLQQNLLYDDDFIDMKLEADYDDLRIKLKTLENKTLLQDLSVYDSWSDYYDIELTRSMLMIHSLKEKMGDTYFYEFIKTYYNKYAFKIVSKKEFITLAEEVYGENLESFFDEWIGNYELPPLK